MLRRRIRPATRKDAADHALMLVWTFFPTFALAAFGAAILIRLPAWISKKNLASG